MKTYLILLTNSKTKERFIRVSTGSFSSVYRSAKTAIREFAPDVRKDIYIQSISEL